MSPESNNVTVMLTAAAIAIPPGMDLAFPVCFIVAVIISMYSEIMARLLKTPAAPVVTTSLIPLIPGGSLYYTMSSAFESDFSKFIEKAVTTLELACALALGIIIVTALSQLIFSRVRSK